MRNRKIQTMEEFNKETISELLGVTEGSDFKSLDGFYFYFL